MPNVNKVFVAIKKYYNDNNALEGKDCTVAIRENLAIGNESLENCLNALRNMKLISYKKNEDIVAITLTELGRRTEKLSSI